MHFYYLVVCSIHIFRLPYHTGILENKHRSLYINYCLKGYCLWRYLLKLCDQCIYFTTYTKIGNIRKWLCYILRQIVRDLKQSYCHRNTSGSLGEREIEVGTRAYMASVSTLFRVLPNFHKCFYNVWEHGGKNLFYFFYKITRRRLKRGNSLMYQ